MENADFQLDFFPFLSFTLSDFVLWVFVFHLFVCVHFYLKDYKLVNNFYSVVSLKMC